MERTSDVRSIVESAGSTRAANLRTAEPELHRLLASFCPDWRGPSVVVDARSLELRYANGHARDMLDRGFPAHLSGGRITINSAHAMRRLNSTMQALLSDATRTAMLVVDDEDTRTTYALRIVLQHLPHTFAADRIAVVDFVKASIDPPPSLLRAIADAFDLTAAEGSVLGHLAAGLSLREIAALRNVRVETVRNQCKTVLSKMRCRRQADLVRVVAGLSQRDIAEMVR
jgi:DNA-binding CsgD family transcriptional regulator